VKPKVVLVETNWVVTVVLLAMGLFISSCAKQVEAQDNRQVEPSSPMNSQSIEPAPNPEDDKFKPPHPNTGRIQELPLPANPNADIGKEVSVKRALKLAELNYKTSNAKVIDSSVMSYRDAIQKLSGWLAEDDPTANTSVRLIEISGKFNRKKHPRFQKNASSSSPTFTKGFIIIRAADGYLLFTQFLVE
jgi:hypothetical protein